MPRNSSGVYSKPSGTTAVSGATASSSKYNELTDDIGSEITASLPRDGSAAMTSPLEAASGTVSLPGLTFSASTDSGWYRISSTSYGFSVGGVKIVGVTSAAFSVDGNLVVTGTVDGRDVATDGAKLDTIATSATANAGTMVGDLGGATDKVPRSDGLGGVTLQASGVDIDDTDNMTGVNDLTVDNDLTVTNNLDVTGDAEVTGNIGVGVTPLYALDVAGDAYIGARDTSTVFCRVGHGATGNRSVAFDLVGDTTYPNFGFRIVRGSGGANTTTSITHRGTGDFSLITSEAADLLLKTTNTTRMTISAAGTIVNEAHMRMEQDRNTQTGTTYTLVLADQSKTVEMNNASANTLTIPPNSSVAFPVGTEVNICQYGAGGTTVAAGAGVTIRSKNSNLALSAQYVTVTARKRTTDEWVLVGDLV